MKCNHILIPGNAYCVQCNHRIVQGVSLNGSMLGVNRTLTDYLTLVLLPLAALIAAAEDLWARLFPA